MEAQTSFDALSEVIERFESRGWPVREADATMGTERQGMLDATLVVSIPLEEVVVANSDASFTTNDASLTAGGDLQLTVSASALSPEPTTDSASVEVEVEDRSVHVDGDKLLMTGELRILQADAADGEGPASTDELSSADDEPAASTADRDGTDALSAHERRDDRGAGSISDETADAVPARLEEARSPDVPPFDDTRYLQVLYESCETFTEMSEYIPMDIAAETVRRYMIEADVHDPNSYDTSGRDDSADADEADSNVVQPDGSGAEGSNENTPTQPSADPLTPDSEETLVADGVGLPEGVHIEDVVDAVAGSTVVYEVQRALDLSHDQTRDLLRQLDVLDLVLHRIDGPARPPSKDEVIGRIRQRTTGQA
ncbi:MAG: hypothetical protein ABEJ79_07480 [Halolamina sp.]